LGQIREFSCHYDRLRPIVRDRWRERDGPGAGIWYDLAPHLIDQALQLFGMPQSLYADIQLQRVGAQAPDYFHALLRYPETRVILHASMNVADNRFHLAAHGSGGSFVKYGLDRQEAALKAGRKPGDHGWGEDDSPVVFTRADEETETATQEPITLERGDYRLYYAGVRDAIAGTGSNPVTGEEALAVMRLLELGMASAERRRELNLP
jgi:predicted dehydrogenase